ncbi:MAG: MBL fold metallo-hydrolase, partial [Clostridiales bacterium]|nr:MBL fold metallo-hydrolase [Clostridiales bacterium]
MDTLTITYLGQCGFLIEGEGARIATDPYLSDYVDKLLYSERTPWKRLYPPPTTLARLRPDAVAISHAHYDHMDPETIGQYLAAGGEAVFAAPAPEVPALGALGVQKVIEARAEQPFAVGGATITPIACAHTQFHTDDQGRFHELSYLIELDGNVVFFGGDMSLYDGLAERLACANCHLLLLPVNGRDAARTENDIIGNIDAAEAAALA